MEFWDDYEHSDPSVTYIPESIKTQEIEDSITHELSGCKCENECTLTCPCCERSGAFYSFLHKSQLNHYSLNIENTNKPVYECNDNCKCKNRICGNKLVQFGPRKNLKIINTQKGFGLVTDADIKKGNFICEYAGEIITPSEAQSRFVTYTQRNLEHNYIFCINERFGQRCEKTFIDPTFYGNVGRYINHSCSPNCFLVPIRIQNEIPLLCIFAKVDINGGTEVTFNYGEVDENSDNTSKKRCLCFSPNCRKYLPFDGSI